MKKRSDSINRLIYTLILLSIFILIGIGAFVVNAYGTSNPVVFGHSAGEIDGLETGIPTGFCIFSDVQASCPAGWTRRVQLDGRTLRADSVPGGTGGSESHTHIGGEHNHQWYDYVGSVNDQTYNSAGYAINVYQVAGSGRYGIYTYPGPITSTPPESYTTMAGTVPTSSESSWAPYTNVIVCCKD